MIDFLIFDDGAYLQRNPMTKSVGCTLDESRLEQRISPQKTPFLLFPPIRRQFKIPQYQNGVEFPKVEVPWREDKVSFEDAAVEWSPLS